MTKPLCAACAPRERVTSLRNNFIGPCDTTLGLVLVEGQLYACPACDLRYRREVEEATMFHDYDMYYFTRMDLPAPAMKKVVCRCPKCGSTGAHADESRSRLEFTHMQCDACGHGGLFDSYQRDEDWFAEVEDRGVGCANCTGPDAAAAWTAMQAQRLSARIEESHFSVRLTRCICGQIFVIVCTERIDWKGGEDDQTWLALPLSAEEQAKLMACGENDVPGLVTEIGRGRRFLVRSFPTNGALSAWWRKDGFAIGPHD